MTGLTLEGRKEEFNKILLYAIDEEMKRILGTVTTHTIYLHVEQNEHLKPDDIPNNLEKFVSTLERIFNAGALVIEKAIMKNLHSRLSLKNETLNLKYKSEEQFNFINYVNDLEKYHTKLSRSFSPTRKQNI